MPIVPVRPLVKHFIQIMSNQRFLFFFFLLSFHGASSTFSSICTESETLCNGVKISYPFWTVQEPTNGTTASNVFCGYQGFGLRCSADNKTSPILTLPSHTYHVKDINYENRSITLVDVDADVSWCPRLWHNVTVDTLPLQIQSDDSLNLTFYFNCNLEGFHSKLGANLISCLNTTGSANSSYVSEEEAEGFDWTAWCEDKVVATVKETEPLKDNLVDGYAAAIKAGFDLDWRVAENCSRCESSGGRCGLNNRTKEFVCFCENSAMVTDGRTCTDLNRLVAENCSRCESSGGWCGFNNRTTEFVCFCKNSTMVTDGRTCRGGRVSWVLIAGLSVAATTTVGMLLGMFLFLRYRRRRQPNKHPYNVTRAISSGYSSRTGLETSEASYYGLPLFEYEELREATNNFDPGKEIGDGGFGTVFYGKLRDGRAVAVKRLYEHNYKRTAQFMNEVEILSKLHHPNLVHLYGCTSRQSHRLLLVYEYVPNGTVADHLHGDLAKPGSLPWLIRMNIAVETASALVYLHASDIIHRDVKTNNILLDENFKVKVADFGLSRLFPMNVTHVSTAPQGTPGYVDPEYNQCYQLTDKSDVYSFGVVLMELISSLPAVDIMRHRHEINLSTMAVNKIQSDALHELVDAHLGFELDSKTRRKIEAVAELGFRCLQHGKDMRPSMAEVLSTLQEVQKQGSEEEKVEEDESRSDAVRLLKVDPLMLSPDSVMAKWASMKSTPNTST